MHRFSKSVAIKWLFAVAAMVVPHAAQAGVVITIAPPPLPVYLPPPVPGPDYIWSPGYWAYADEDEDYYWVPGTWVRAPEPGLYWTPGYWGWREGVYAWNAGYWGPHVGYYGGIDYGCGYGGFGYHGGYWNHGAFFYNTAVVHVNETIIHNTYNKTVINETTVNRVSFNGPGGATAKPTSKELEFDHEHHIGPTDVQTHHQHDASGNHALFASVNHGSPGIAATSKPSNFSGQGIVGAKDQKLDHSNLHTLEQSNEHKDRALKDASLHKSSDFDKSDRLKARGAGDSENFKGKHAHAQFDQGRDRGPHMQHHDAGQRGGRNKHPPS